MSAILFVFNYSCVPDSPAYQDPEVTKRFNRINDILDKIDTDINPLKFVYSEMSFDGDVKESVSSTEECRFLIENPDIALPIMFKRLDNKKLCRDYYKLGIYFIVFEKTKSAESIPYIAEYLTKVGKDWDDRTFNCAIWAAQQITSLKLTDNKHDCSELFDQRKEIADKLNKWYEEHKKATK